MPLPSVFPVLPAKEVLPSRPYGLTRDQHDTMMALQEMTLIDGQPPRLRDIGAELGLDPTQVHRLLKGLRARGYVDWVPQRWRSLVVRVPLPVPAELAGERPHLEILRLPEAG